jgi:hypothetical protein
MSLYTGGPYKQANGTTISAVSTKVDGGSMKSNSSSNENFRNVTYQYGNNVNPRVVAGVDLGQADWGSLITASSTTATGITNGTGQWAGLAVININAAGYAVGDPIYVKNTSTGSATTGIYDGIHRVMGISNASAFVLNTPYIYAATGAAEIRFRVAVGSVASQQRRNFLFMKGTGQTHGVANTKLMAGASDYGRAKVHAVRAVRTQQVATAIRDGNFISISGKFSTQPTQANDFAGWGTDEVTQNSSTNYGLKGEFVYRYGGPSGSMNDYNGKTA